MKFKQVESLMSVNGFLKSVVSEHIPLMYIKKTQKYSIFFLKCLEDSENRRIFASSKG